ASGPARSPRSRRPHRLDVIAAVAGGRLRVDWGYGAHQLRKTTVEAMAERFAHHLRALIGHCRSRIERGLAGYTPSDFPLAGLDGAALDRLLGSDSGIEDLYPLSPLQEGILFHSLYAPGSGVYVDQTIAALQGAVDGPALEQACRQLVERH